MLMRQFFLEFWDSCGDAYVEYYLQGCSTILSDVYQHTGYIYYIHSQGPRVSKASRTTVLLLLVYSSIFDI
jgi:hypothetical protein